MYLAKAFVVFGLGLFLAGGKAYSQGTDGGTGNAKTPDLVEQLAQALLAHNSDDAQHFAGYEKAGLKIEKERNTGKVSLSIGRMHYISDDRLTTTDLRLMEESGVDIDGDGQQTAVLINCRLLPKAVVENSALEDLKKAVVSLDTVKQVLPQAIQRAQLIIGNRKAKEIIEKNCPDGTRCGG